MNNIDAIVKSIELNYLLKQNRQENEVYKNVDAELERLYAAEQIIDDDDDRSIIYDPNEVFISSLSADESTAYMN